MSIRARVESLFLSRLGLLLLPRGCAGCGSPDAVLCADCRSLFDKRLARSVYGVTAGAVACAQYTGAARLAVLAWKDHDDRECDIPFAACLARAALDLPEVRSAPSIVLIPVPSSAASARARGRQHMAVLVKRVCRILREQHGKDATVVGMLAAVGHKRSVQLSNARQRVDRADARFRMRGSYRVHPESMVLLFDDIITTGSTMRACVGTLTSAGVVVHAVLALADTPARGIRPVAHQAESPASMAG